MSKYTDLIAALTAALAMLRKGGYIGDAEGDKWITTSNGKKVELDKDGNVKKGLGGGHEGENLAEVAKKLSAAARKTEIGTPERGAANKAAQEAGNKAAAAKKESTSNAVAAHKERVAKAVSAVKPADIKSEATQNAKLGVLQAAYHELGKPGDYTSKVTAAYNKQFSGKEDSSEAKNVRAALAKQGYTW